MRWIVKAGDIVDEPADVLICSANVFLNLSGGVGGEILLRYGDGMQKELHQFLLDHRLRFVQRGDVVRTQSHETKFKSVLHAVAVDGFYQSDPQVITDIVTKALRMAAALDARRIALTALATGFGRLTMQQFASGTRPLRDVEFPPIEQVTICVRHESEAELISIGLGIA